MPGTMHDVESGRHSGCAARRLPPMKRLLQSRLATDRGLMKGDDESTIERGNWLLTWTHRGCLAVLVICAGMIALGAEAGSDDPPPLEFTMVAMGLAVASIVARRLSTSPRLAASFRFGSELLGLVLAAAIGITAIGLAATAGDKQNALLFVLGGGILCLRPPSALGTPSALGE